MSNHSSMKNVDGEGHDSPKLKRRDAAPMHVNKDGTQHITRTLRALELLSQRSCTDGEVASVLNVHVRTARRLLERMVSEGYVVAVGPQYTATLRLLTLAGRVIERTDLVVLAFSYVVDLRNRTGETAILSVATEKSVVHVLQETGESVVMVKPNLGGQVPFHCTAHGKVLMAFLPIGRDRILQLDFQRLTKSTIVDPEIFVAELANVRQQGYATDKGEFHAELRCVAAPVFGATGEIVAAIGIQAPSSRLLIRQLPAVAAIVTTVARELSATLGFSPHADRGGFRLPAALTSLSLGVRIPHGVRAIEEAT